MYMYDPMDALMLRYLAIALDLLLVKPIIFRLEVSLLWAEPRLHRQDHSASNKMPSNAMNLKTHCVVLDCQLYFVPNLQLENLI